MTETKYLDLKEYVTDDARHFVSVREEPRTPINEPCNVVMKCIADFTCRPEDVVAEREFVNREDAFLWALEVARKDTSSATEDYAATLAFAREVQQFPRTMCLF